jgi:hypothetical protein
MPQIKPSFAQRLQYLQFLQALQGLAPTQVAALVVDAFAVGLILFALTKVPAARNITRKDFFIMV